MEQRERIKQEEAARMQKQLDLQRKFCEEQAALEGRELPKKPRPKKMDSTTEDEEGTSSTLAESTREVLKWKKKVREMEAIQARQDAGESLDAAQVKKLAGLEEAKEKLAAAEEREAERLEKMRQEEEARREAEAVAAAARAE